eukprot:TRINITY_DN1421_c0_g1_i1.p1 TRINITY_DN1421_c0_g1~~TRINITY_DN1421_c0_g1_i1.p1  ORF type:complete len:434 (+),score=83.02 TRINITY_DN1421_c0_g1_i1:709-2010(+)
MPFIEVRKSEYFARLFGIDAFIVFESRQALRQFQFRVGRDNFCLMHVSLVPVLGVVGEQKTKPTQATVRELRALGLSPDLILCRSSTELHESTKEKISNFCHVPIEFVIGVHDVSNTYRVPELLLTQGVYDVLCQKLNLVKRPNVDFEKWREVADSFDRLKANGSPVHIAMVGKYTGLSDAYLSVIKALEHASFYAQRGVKIDWVEATDLEDPKGEKYEESWNVLRNAHGILVPGGFGNRGIEGKIAAAKYARENKKPYFGICLGLQVAVIETARNVVGWANATSEEFDKDAARKVVVYMPEISKTHLGGTMRLGSRETIFKNDQSVAYQLYKHLQPENPNPMRVAERHRHRYEVNPEVVADISSKSGLQFVGQDETGTRQEIVEIPDHPYFVAVQYHPEFKSRPTRPSPPFVGLVLAASGQLEQWLSSKNGK